ncbi:MAG: ABC-type multidrug transport system fused ATPase/permease subunit [Akkermansiaceae bacterium]|jgi:ABC-type multidrug transport system fused ATPase/permease subunit
MTFRLQLSEEDYLKAAKLFGRRWLLRLALPYFVILSVLMYWISSRSAGLGLSFQVSFIVFLVLVLFYKWFVQMPSRTRKLYHQQIEVQSELRCTLEEEHFAIEHRNGFVKKQWEEFRRWTLSNDLILIFPTDRAYFLIPKHQLTEEEWQETVAMMERKLGTG